MSGHGSTRGRRFRAALLVLVLGVFASIPASAQDATDLQGPGASAVPSVVPSVMMPIGTFGSRAPEGAAPGIATPAIGSAYGSQPSPGRSVGADRSALPGSPADARGDASRRAELPALGRTQFQRFVQDATGRALPLHGYNLFESGGFPALSNVPVPASYVVGPGDEIDLRLWGAVEVAVRLSVDRNGQISIPKVGPVTVAGATAEQLERLLRTRVGRVFTNFDLSATLGRLRTVQIFVVGEARKPGAYLVSGLATLVSALFESGGPTSNGSMRAIRLVRAGKLITTFDLYAFMHRGDTTADARLQPGDVIVIPPAGPRVALVGALENPAIYELATTQEPLGDVLSYTGRVGSVTSLHKALVERIDNARERAQRSVEERKLDAAGLASPVRDGDIVTLFRIRDDFANAVTLRGSVAQAVRHPFRAGMKVSDLIPEVDALIQPNYFARKNVLVQFEAARDERKPGVSGERIVNDVKNLLDEINWDYAAIERLDPVELRMTLIPFNLARAVKSRDPAHDLVLQPGDVVTVFSVHDLPVPMDKRTRIVRLGGEVRVPGVYQLLPGETLPQLVARAGGFSQNAYPYGTVFTREGTRAQQQENLDKAIRRVEADVAGQSASMAAQASAGDAAQSQALINAQLAAQRQLVARLHSLRASGRIALEMDPGNPKLPPIPLEDGDQITVPNKSAFVGVFGAVMSESSMLHRPGQTVKDYVDKAGLTRDADLDAMLILRADGSAESNAGRRWSFLSDGILGMPLNPGDSIFVPEQLDRRSAWVRFVQGAKDWTSIVYQLGLGAAAIKVLRQ